MSAEDIEYIGGYKEFPTKESALDWLDNYLSLDERNNLIRALQQEPILNKIRTEILEEKDFAYADFERYKVEYLGQDWEDVYDSLPQDDFRYGMERCIDIIDKYKAEGSDKK